jgi:hypothetical protein
VQINSTIRVNLKVTGTTRAARASGSRGDAAFLLGCFAVLGVAGAITAGVMHARNTGRVTRYEADPSCQAPLVNERGI